MVSPEVRVRGVFLWDKNATLLGNNSEFILEAENRRRRGIRFKTKNSYDVNPVKDEFPFQK